jgi:hypothetical protein
MQNSVVWRICSSGLEERTATVVVVVFIIIIICPDDGCASCPEMSVHILEDRYLLQVLIDNDWFVKTLCLFYLFIKVVLLVAD